MYEYVSLMINLLLFLSVSVILVIYIKKTWKANAEYAKAKDLVEGVILSFNKDVEVLKQKIEELDLRFQNMQLPDMAQIKTDIDTLSSRLEKLQEFCLTLEKKIENMKINFNKSSETFTQEKTGLKDQRELILPVKPAFPLKRERALAPLTPTELKVLEILSTEGDKTVREIRSRIGLTREHTGRLMKNLYDKGYVERRTDRIPYVYRIKKEMEEMLRNL